MLQMLRSLLLFEAAAFILAAMTHLGLFVEGYAHRKAATAESVIAVVLLLGLALTYFRPGSARRIALAVQGFALFGTFVGLFTIAIGIGPRTTPDMIFHAGIVIALIAGLIAAVRTRSPELR